MKGFSKKALILTAAAVLSAGSVAGCGKLEDKDVVATVSGDKITAGVANFYTRYQQAVYETNYAAMLGKTGEEMWKTKSGGATMEESVKTAAIEGLELMYVLEDHMGEYEVSLSDEEKAAIKKAAAKFIESNGEKEKEAVSATSENVERVFELMTIQEKMRTVMTADVDTKVSDEEAAQKSMQYVKFGFTKTGEDGKSEELSADEKKELKKTAEEFAKGAKETKKFDDYAKEKEQEVKTATFDSDSSTPDADVVKAADKLKKNEVSDVIETESGYYVVKLTSELDREATDAKKEQIVNTRKQEKFNELSDEWKKEAKIKLDEKVWKKISFVKQGVTIKEVDTTPYANGPANDEKENK